MKNGGGGSPGSSISISRVDEVVRMGIVRGRGIGIVAVVLGMGLVLVEQAERARSYDWNSLVFHAMNYMNRNVCRDDQAILDQAVLEGWLVG